MEHPEFGRSYLAIEQHVRRAHAQRALYMAELIGDGLAAAVRGLARLGALVGRGLHAPRRTVREPLAPR